MQFYIIPCIRLAAIGFTTALPVITHAATLSSSNLGSLDLSPSPITIVHGTELSSTLIRDAMWDAVGIRFGGPQRIAAYNTDLPNGSGGADPDIERDSANPPGAAAGEWVAGNFGSVSGLSAAMQLGLIGVIQNLSANPGETTDGNGVPIFTTPNDNASGGTLVIELKASLGFRQFTVTAVDVDNAAGDSYLVTLTGANGGSTTVNLVDNATNQGLVPLYGDRTLNSLGTVSLPGNEVITQVEYTITGDSGGTGGFLFDTIPEPSTGLLTLLGLGLALRRRR